jgi:hypothetical protein
MQLAVARADKIPIAGAPRQRRLSLGGPDLNPEFLAKSSASVRFFREAWLAAADGTEARAHPDALTAPERRALGAQIMQCLHAPAGEGAFAPVVQWLACAFDYFGIAIDGAGAATIGGVAFDPAFSPCPMLLQALRDAWWRGLQCQETEQVDLRLAHNLYRGMMNVRRPVGCSRVSQ